jgi:hypothetical protein
LSATRSCFSDESVIAGEFVVLKVLTHPFMSTFDPGAIYLQLGNILALLKNGDAERALQQIADLISELEPLKGSEPHSPDIPNREPEPGRIIAAHLKGAEVQIRATRLALAQESLEKAIEIVGGGKPATATGE